MNFVSYPKIETCFARDVNGTKKLMPDVFRAPEIELLKNLNWEWTEKIDGTNTQIVWDGHKVTFGGRTERADIPKSLLDYLERTFGGTENEELFEQKFGESQVILFGEGYGPKIQKGGNYRDDVSFILFDVKIGDFWLERDSVEDIAKVFNIDVVPIVFYGTIEQAVQYIKTHPNSKVAAEHGKTYAANKDAEVKRVTAEAEADAKVTQAQGEADAIKVKADAEAEANQKLSQSLTDFVLQNKFYEKWNGQLPTVTGSNSTLIDMPVQ